MSLPFVATLTNGNTATIWREGTNKIIYSEAGETVTAVDSTDPVTPIGLYPGNLGAGDILYLSGNELNLARKGIFSGTFPRRVIGTGIPEDVNSSVILDTNNNSALILFQDRDIIRAQHPFSNSGLFTVFEAPSDGTSTELRKAVATRERNNGIGRHTIAWGLTKIPGVYEISAQRFNTNSGVAIGDQSRLFSTLRSDITDFTLATTLDGNMILAIIENDSPVSAIRLLIFDSTFQLIDNTISLERASLPDTLDDISIVHHDAGFLVTFSRTGAETVIKHRLLDPSGTPITEDPSLSSTTFTKIPTTPHTALSPFGNGSMVWGTIPQFGISEIQSRPIFGPGAENDSRFAAFTGAACIPNDPEGDPDGDGHNNTAEFVTGSHPNDRNSIPPPVALVRRSDNSSYFIRAPISDGIDSADHHILEQSVDLRNWELSEGFSTFELDGIKRFYRFTYKLTLEDQ